MKARSLEIFLLAIFSAVCLFAFQKLLFSGTTTLPHDNLYWLFPLFHHFAESLLNGQLPLWNPYEHGGEAFFPILVSGRFLDPIIPLTVLIGGHFTRDTLVLMHWSLFLEAWVNILGAYLFLRCFTTSLWVRVALMPLLFFSLLMLGWHRQTGILLAFTWIPFIAYFLLRLTIFKDRRLSNWLFLGGFVGLNWQFYYFVSTWILLLFFAVGLFVFHRRDLGSFFRDRLNRRGAALALLISLVMVGPNAVLYVSQKDFVFPARMLSAQRPDVPTRGPINHEGGPENVVSALHLPYSVLAYTGTVTCLWDFLQALLPEPAFRGPKGWHGTWRIYHDGHGYFGLLAWILACVGIFLHRPSYRRVVLFVLLATTLFSLGPGGAIHRFLYYVYPPAQLMRHTVLLMGSIYLLLLIFFVGGLDYLSQVLRREASRPALYAKDLFWAYASLLFALFFVILRRPDWEDTAWAFLATAAIVGWALRKRISALGYTVAVALAPFAAALAQAPEPFAALRHALLVVGVPLLLYGLVYRRYSRLSYSALVVTFLMVLTADFFTSFHAQRPMWESKAHPNGWLGVNTLAKPHRFPGPRKLFSPDFPHDPQAIRYLASVRREPTLFSTPYRPVQNFAEGLKIPRWNSFLLPKNYFDLIHSGLPPEEIEKAFAIGESPLQFDGRKMGFQVLDYKHGDVTLAMQTSSAGNLYWADGYDRHWHAYLDGVEIPIVRSKIHFKSVALPEGQHELVWKYRPWGFLAATLLFYVAFSAAMVAGVVFSFEASKSFLPWLKLQRDCPR